MNDGGVMHAAVGCISLDNSTWDIITVLLASIDAGVFEKSGIFRCFVHVLTSEKSCAGVVCGIIVVIPVSVGVK